MLEAAHLLGAACESARVRRQSSEHGALGFGSDSFGSH